MLNLPYIENVLDKISRDLFQIIKKEGKSNPFWNSNFILKTLVFSAAVTNQKIPHGLNFVPLDIILTSKTGAGSVTINYDLTDGVNVNLTTTDACAVRLLIGRVAS